MKNSHIHISKIIKERLTTYLAQQEIAEQVGISKSRTAKIIGNFSVKEIDNAFEEGKPVEEIVELFDLSNAAIHKLLGKLNILQSEKFNPDTAVKEICHLSIGFHTLGG